MTGKVGLLCQVILIQLLGNSNIQQPGINIKRNWKIKVLMCQPRLKIISTFQERLRRLGGKPDLIAKKGNSCRIIDIKTGQPRASDHVQVMLYMYAVPKAFPEKYRNVVLEGRVVYGEREVAVPSSAVDEKFVKRFSELIRRLASNEPAKRVPSFGECRYCNIPASECPDRVDKDTSTAEVDDF